MENEIYNGKPMKGLCKECGKEFDYNLEVFRRLDNDEIQINHRTVCSGKCATKYLRAMGYDI